MSKIFVLLFLLGLGGCAHSVHQVHMSDFKPFEKISSGEMISSESSQFVVLGIVGNTDYVNLARNQLIAKCPNGDIQGITTRYSTDLGFFSWTNKIFMQGLCLK